MMDTIETIYLVVLCIIFLPLQFSAKNPTDSILMLLVAFQWPLLVINGSILLLLYFVLKLIEKINRRKHVW